MRDLPLYIFSFLESCTERWSCHDCDICFLVTGSFGYFGKKVLKGLLFYRTKGYSIWFLQPKEVSIQLSFSGRVLVIFESFLVIFWSFWGHFWSFLDHMSVILHHEKFSPNLNFALINIWVICWSILGHLWSLKNSAQIDMSVECGQKGTPDKVSKSGNFSTFEKLPGMV